MFSGDHIYNPCNDAAMTAWHIHIHVAVINKEHYNTPINQVCIYLFIIHIVKGCMVQRLKSIK
jgi:hypothetical protein